jgi:hypothetical protein
MKHTAPKSVKWVEFPIPVTIDVTPTYEITQVWDQIVEVLRLDKNEKTIRLGKIFIERLTKIVEKYNKQEFENGYKFRRNEEFVRGDPGHHDNEMGM